MIFAGHSVKDNNIEATKRKAIIKFLNESSTTKKFTLLSCSINKIVYEV